ncbi:MAG: M28 family peptidase [Parabacteroides sp.]|nr:M28 family peptidase [Parabacteroides sp.]
MSYAELLKQLTVDCKDDGIRFLKRDRIQVIQTLLENSDYQLLYAGELCLLYGKSTSMDSYRILVSSHIDCVYTTCFVTDESEDCWKGTFDNSATNAALIELMLKGELDDSVLIAFTGDEERNSAGAVEVIQILQEKDCPIERALVLDVTNEGWDDEAAFSIENDRGFDIITGYQLINLLQASEEPCVFVHEAEPDETWEYYSFQTNDRPRIPCLSLCLPVLGNMHEDAGVWLRKSSIEPYKKILKQLANAPF